MSSPEFQAWPKITRWRSEWMITEKIDGTNACVIVPEHDSEPLAAQSRTRLITPENDNYNFAAWVKANTNALRYLAPGYHYGEWWGTGIQRGYGLFEKRFSLFNPDNRVFQNPECTLAAVPILERVSKAAHVGDAINYCMEDLRKNGSRASPGFMKPEGIVIYHYPSRTMFKKLLEGDDIPKGVANAEATTVAAV